MANKTVLDFPEITSPEDTDVLYAIRGASTGRDKRITWANLKQFLLSTAHLATTATSSILGHVRLDDAPTRNSTNGVSSDGIWTALYNEAAEREGVDGDLEASIAQEALARSGADSGLSTSISDEASARESGDSGLQSQVNALTTQITKLWAPTSSTQVEMADGNMVIDTEFVDGLCITVHPGQASTSSFIQLRDAPPEVQVFHVRVRLPRTDTARNYAVVFSYPSALDNNYKAYSDFVFPQNAFWGSDDHDQFTPVYTFVRGGTGWILM